jgi:hypothetical protein
MAAMRALAQPTPLPLASSSSSAGLAAARVDPAYFKCKKFSFHWNASENMRGGRVSRVLHE